MEISRLTLFLSEYPLFAWWKGRKRGNHFDCRPRESGDPGMVEGYWV